MHHKTSFILFGILAGFFLILTHVPCNGQTPATSKDICQSKIDGYVFPDVIRDGDTVRPVTPSDLNNINRVLRSQCMLNAEDMTTYWDAKSEQEREQFFANYARIKTLVSLFSFEQIFPSNVRNAAFTYERFLRATAAFPYLCGEDGQTDDNCKREFATMFAHWCQETARLSLMYETGCAPGQSSPGCKNYISKGTYFYNNKAGSGVDLDYEYFGRGPKQLSYNYNYGRYSWGFYGDMRLVEKPYLLAQDLDNIFVSALWFYMTPVSLKPSMHQVVTGLWQPNSVDISRNILPGFGVTTNIINGGIECGKGTVSPQSMNRIRFFNGGLAQSVQTMGTLYYLGLPTTNEQTDTSLYCNNMQQFTASGAGAYHLYMNQSRYWQCEMQVNESLFSLYDQSPLSTSYNSHACSEGYHCCMKTRDKLKAEKLDNIPESKLEMSTFVNWIGVGAAASAPSEYLLLLLNTENEGAQGVQP